MRRFPFTLTAATKPRSVLFGKQELILRPAGTVYIPAHDLLVAADLHLGKGHLAARRGLGLPPQADIDTCVALDRDRQESGASRLLLLGDVFHAPSLTMTGFDFRAVADAFGANTMLVTGNHDVRLASVAADAGLEVASHLELDSRLLLAHEPVATGQPQIFAHFHPCVTFPSAAGPQRRKCFVVGEKHLILPAFGVFTGGLSVTDPALSGFVEGATIVAI